MACQNLVKQREYWDERNRRRRVLRRGGTVDWEDARRKKGRIVSPETRKKISESIRKLKGKLARKGSDNPNWRGGRINFHGRTLIYCPKHPFPNYSGTHVFEYRLIMEKKLNRYLMPNEIVHHIDGDISNNHVSNLAVMTQSQHAKIDCEKRRNKITGRFQSWNKNS